MLNSSSGWVSNYPVDPTADEMYNVYLMIDLGFVQTVIGVQTRGNAQGGWLTQISVQVSKDGLIWKAELFKVSGNTDTDSVVDHFFSAPVAARFIRIGVNAYEQRVTLRAGALVCGDNFACIDVECGSLSCDSPSAPQLCTKTCGYCLPPTPTPTESPTAPTTSKTLEPTPMPTEAPTTFVPASTPVNWPLIRVNDPSFDIGFGNCATYSRNAPECSADPLGCNHNFCIDDGAYWHCPVACITRSWNDPNWRSKWGDCESYNRRFCSPNTDCNFLHCHDTSNGDDDQGVYAYQACRIACETIVESPFPQPCPPEDSTSFEGPTGVTCSGYVLGSDDHQYCESDGASKSTNCPRACGSCVL
jgi:hypothetical protein